MYFSEYFMAQEPALRAASGLDGRTQAERAARETARPAVRLAARGARAGAGRGASDSACSAYVSEQVQIKHFSQYGYQNLAVPVHSRML